MWHQCSHVRQGAVLALCGQIGAGIFCGLLGLWLEWSAECHNSSLTSAVEEVIPYQHATHGCQHVGFLMPCLASVPEALQRSPQTPSCPIAQFASFHRFRPHAGLPRGRNRTQRQMCVALVCPMLVKETIPKITEVGAICSGLEKGCQTSRDGEGLW
jgi:hypothetical protein